MLFLFSLNIHTAQAEQQCQAPKDKVNIWLFLPDDQRSSFWLASNRFARAVASDFNINLRLIEVEDDENNRVAFEELIRSTFADLTNAPPDFVVSILYGGGELSQVTLFEKYDIPFITINSSLDQRILQLTGNPRERFSNWKAHMSPNEHIAGMQMVDALFAANKGRRMAIIGGYTHSKVNNHRIEGAMQRAEQIGIKAVPPMYTDWTKPDSIKAAKALLRRVPDFDILLTTGPDIAAGALEVMQAAGKSATVGSFDWAASNVDLIEQGLLEASLGGHFMEAGWAMILAYDLMRELDFKDDTGVLMDTKLGMLNKDNVTAISPLIKQQKWQDVDFTQYSKCLNQTIKTYDFALQ